MSRLRRVPLLVILALALVISGNLQVALAADAHSASSTLVTSPPGAPKPVLGTLTLNCSTLTRGQLEYAIHHNYCPSSGVTPYNTVYGNCGSSTLWVYAAGQGNADFYEAINSSLGTVVYVSYNVNWYNWSTTGNGSIPGQAWPWSSSWSNVDQRFTAAGYVTASMNGWVQLIWGGTCTIAVPTDSDNIS